MSALAKAEFAKGGARFGIVPAGLHQDLGLIRQKLGIFADSIMLGLTARLV
jgi:hypothetical protein